MTKVLDKSFKSLASIEFQPTHCRSALVQSLNCLESLNSKGFRGVLKKFCQSTRAGASRGRITKLELGNEPRNNENWNPKKYALATIAELIVRDFRGL